MLIAFLTCYVYSDLFVFLLHFPERWRQESLLGASFADAIGAAQSVFGMRMWKLFRVALAILTALLYRIYIGKAIIGLVVFKVSPSVVFEGQVVFLYSEPFSTR